MAQNLFFNSDSGVKMIVFDVDQAAGHRLLASIKEKDPKAVSRVSLANSVAAVAEDASITIMALPTPAIVQQTVTELSQNLSPSESRLIIDCSTIDPDTSRECARLLAERGMAQFFDAPMSGGSAGAAAGALTFMVGYPPERSSSPKQEVFAQEHLLPILGTMGNTVWRMGDIGSGSATKLTNNYLTALCNIATCEALNLGIKLGIQPSMLVEVINSSTGMNWLTQNSLPIAGLNPSRPTAADRDYAPGFTNELMKKDIQLAVKSASLARVPLPLSQKAIDTYALASFHYPKKDVTIVYKMLQERCD